MSISCKRIVFSLISLLSVASLICPVGAAGLKGDVKRGKKVFQDMQCAICHANGGNNLNPERPLIGDGFLKRYPPTNNAAIEKVIREGIKSKGMPDFGKDKMSDQDLADVIAYIRSLTPSKGAPAAAAKKK